jgi:DNA-binding MarR family transcriptional regulator
MAAVMSSEHLASELQVHTLRVYWYLINSPKTSVGPRDVQRKMGFSSPNLAIYHLDKLVELGIVEKVAGEYRITRIVDVWA